MRKAVALLVAAMFVLSVFGMSLAAEKKATGVKKMTGEITAIDAAAKTLTVKELKEEKTVSYSDTTPVMEGKKKMSAADMKVGEKVTVTYKEEDGKNMAEKIAIHKSTAKKKTK